MVIRQGRGIVFKEWIIYAFKHWYDPYSRDKGLHAENVVIIKERIFEHIKRK